MDSPIDKIEQFKKSVQDENNSTQIIVRKFIMHGTPHVFEGKEELYFDLKNEIGEKFKTHPELVRMVGSAKLGFSIKPTRLFGEFGDDSDIDMVIISDDVFDNIWNELFDEQIWDYEKKSRSEAADKKLQQFFMYFFRGWIRPDKILPDYKVRSEWFEFFQKISYGKYGNHKVTGAIYKNFHYFEHYHETNIKNIRLKLKG